ncbi:hypothetical protein AS593_21345 [Caulobacter vibrioides]|nr:hypothetical protein AS593_21345 [Caulobacter vibrioides]
MKPVSFGTAAWVGGALVAALAAGGPAAAQTRTKSAGYVVLAKAAPTGELTAKRGEPLLVQQAVAPRAARLTAETPSPFGFGKVKSFPAGAKMFGVPSGDGFAYCAVAASTARWWAGDEFACFEDLDSDGDFDQVRPSGSPFMNVPLFVFSLGAPKPLAAPAPYERLPYAEGPAVEYGLTWSSLKQGGKNGEPVWNIVSIQPAFASGLGFQPIRNGGSAKRLNDGETVELAVKGSKVTVLGLTPEGDLRYRVDEPLPAQVDRISMAITTTTTYTPIFIPR